jgi:hypothetical protein
MSLLSVVAFVPKGLFIDNIAKHMEIGGQWNNVTYDFWLSIFQCFGTGSGLDLDSIRPVDPGSVS